MNQNGFYLRGGGYAIILKLFLIYLMGFNLKENHIYLFFRHWSQRVHNLNTLDFGVYW